LRCTALADAAAREGLYSLMRGLNVASASSACAFSCRIASSRAFFLRISAATRSGSDLLAAASSRERSEMAGVKDMPASSSAMRLCCACSSASCFVLEDAFRRSTRPSHSRVVSSVRCSSTGRAGAWRRM